MEKEALYTYRDTIVYQHPAMSTELLKAWLQGGIHLTSGEQRSIATELLARRRDDECATAPAPALDAASDIQGFLKYADATLSIRQYKHGNYRAALEFNAGIDLDGKERFVKATGTGESVAQAIEQLSHMMSDLLADGII